MKKIDVPSPYFLATMQPLDSKNVVNTIDELANLGENNYKAFSYYRGMIIYCHEDGNRYEWTDKLEGKDDVKLLYNDYKYPRGTVIDQINYSSLKFNFIPFVTDSKSKAELTNEDNTLTISDGKINTNVGRNLQESSITRLEFPIKIIHEKDYSYIEDVFIAGISIPRRFWRHYEGYLNILDFTSVIQLPVLPKYDIELKGTYFYIREE